MQKASTYFVGLICLLTFSAHAQRARIEDCDCSFKVDPEVMAILPPDLKTSFSAAPNLPDSSFQKVCGYLVVPENRNKNSAKLIRLPFIIVRSKNSAKKKDPVLFTGGGPGGSSLSSALGLSKSPMIEERDCIVLEQRGTRFALPYLRNFELDKAIKESYRKNLNKDSMVIEGVKKYKVQLEKRGIDLAGYNTDETVSDIHDLIRLLQIDSINLFGISYSGGLMTAVLQKDPTHIRSLILDSPLPTFVPIDEDEPVNFMEALNIYFRHVETDSSNQQLYGNLKARFHTYFSTIISKEFLLRLKEKNQPDSISIVYTKNELLQVILARLYDDENRKSLASMIIEIVNGKHDEYVTGYFNELFRKNSAPDGMRISVYCADQTAYHSERVREELNKIYPYLTDFSINDVYDEMCKCWKVPAIKSQTKTPFYSSVPVLLADGEMDPACRPLYIDQLSHYMPNSQKFLLINKGHGVIGKAMTHVVKSFLDNPFRKITSTDKNIIAY